MSEEINNREYRQQVIKELISELHSGKSVDEVKGKFESAFKGVSAGEISEAEQALMREGMPVSEIQRLCDVHASVFKGSIEEIHQPENEWNIPGHPANVLKHENREIEKLSSEIRQCINSKDCKENLENKLQRLMEIDKHYLKKENLIFPYMERYGVSGPPKVMWGVDDEIREKIKELRGSIKTKSVEEVKSEIEFVLNKISEMIFKEENIMLPMLIENLTEDDWSRIASESGNFGYCLLTGVPAWKPSHQNEIQNIKKEESLPGTVTFPTGVLKVDELIRMLDTLPIDITFVDKYDTVKYFSQAAERIFPRTKAVIGRNVSNCHPPASVHIVEKLVEDFKAGKKDHEDFWINMDDKFILIRYFAVRSEKGEYMGTLEVTQNIKPIQEIKGEKRLMS